MLKHNLQQNTPEWHQFRATHYGASETAAMLGLSKYTTRTELLREKHTGIGKDHNGATLAVFSRGHETEALARPLMEEIIGEDLYPVTCSDGNLSCSCDGLTMGGEIAFEHKQWNQALAEQVSNCEVPESHMPQCQQIMLITGAQKVIFTVSDGTLENFVYTTVLPDPAWFERIRNGWAAFHHDLETYVPPEAIPEVVAAPIKDLPAITYKMDGMHLSTNLRNDVKPAILALVEQSKKPLETDQDFADLDALCKKFKQAEEQCALVQSQAMGEIKDVDAFCRDLKELSEIMRQARIAGEKAVTSEKDARKMAILTGARDAFAKHINGLAVEIKPIQLPIIVPDFSGAIKGMKKLSAMQEAVDNTLRDSKMLADAAAQDIRAKMAWFKENALSQNFLFHDLQQIIYKQTDDFKLLVTTRINKHGADEAAKIERIRAEEKSKAEAAAAEVFEAARAKADQDLMPTIPTMAEDRATMEAQIEARRKQSQIAEQSKPFNGAPAKPVRPPDRAIIEAIQTAFGPGITYGTACDWILEVAEGLRVSA